MADRLDEIKTSGCGNPDCHFGLIVFDDHPMNARPYGVPCQSCQDRAWLIAEVERLRGLIDETYNACMEIAGAPQKSDRNKRT